LYLPQPWVEDPAYVQRRQTCGAPAEVSFQTKLALGLAMIRAVVMAGTLRCRWLAADEAFGRDTAFLDAVAELGVWYVAEVSHDTHVCPHDGTTDRVTVRTLADAAPAVAWERHTIKDGRKGPLIADIVMQRVQTVRDGDLGPTVWLVLCWNPETGELKTYLSNAPADTPLATLVRMGGMRWPIETCFETGKQLLGMGDDEVRSWRGWHHQMTLVIRAHFFLVWMQIRLKKTRRLWSPRTRGCRRCACCGRPCCHAGTWMPRRCWRGSATTNAEMLWPLPPTGNGSKPGLSI
jgi:SRSO17 transposase